MRTVAVGTPVARRPPHRSGRAGLPHPAPALGDDAEPREKIPGGLTYPLERAGRASPALRPERVAPERVPLGRPPSLHRLRGRSPGVVRGLRRYYGAVRLPTSVRHRRMSLDFPVRPPILLAAGGRGISRLPCEVFPGVLGVSDRTGSLRVSRWRRDGCGLPAVSRASAPPTLPLISRLDTRPARTPVNASPWTLRTVAHDSGPVWVATPSPHETPVRDTSPVSTGARTPRWTPDLRPLPGRPLLTGHHPSGDKPRLLAGWGTWKPGGRLE